MHFGLYVYPWDFSCDDLDRQIEKVCELGIDQLIYSVMYHDSRQLNPHGPHGRVVSINGGVSYVPVDVSSYPEGLAPDTQDRYPNFRDVAAAGRKYGLTTSAWTVSLHRDDLARSASRHRLACVENAFGDFHLTQLCPASDTTVQYLVAHLRDIERAGASDIILEGCQFPGVAHGAAHESLFTQLSEDVLYMIALCFCSSCQRAFAAADLDPLKLRQLVTSEVQTALDQGPHYQTGSVGPIESSDLSAAANVRAERVAELLRNAVSGCEAAVHFCDQATISQTFRTGMPGPRPSAYDGWRYGLSYAMIADTCDSISICGYLRDPGDLESQLASYKQLAGSSARLRVSLRPLSLDTPDRESLMRKIEIVGRCGITSVDFYNLAFSTAPELGTMRQAIGPFKG